VFGVKGQVRTWELEVNWGKHGVFSRSVGICLSSMWPQEMPLLAIDCKSYCGPEADTLPRILCFVLMPNAPLTMHPKQWLLIGAS
jgi:hypothetical protein